MADKPYINIDEYWEANKSKVDIPEAPQAQSTGYDAPVNTTDMLATNMSKIETDIGNFGRGIHQGLQGVNLGLAQLTAPIFGLDKSRLQEMEADRRAKTEQLKSQSGRGNFLNPVSVGEFVGETAPWLLAPGGSLATIPRAIGSGMTAGGLTGLAKPVIEGENRLTNTLQGAAAGGLVGGTLGGVKKLASPVIDFAKRKAEGFIDRTVNPIYKTDVGKADKLIADKMRIIAPEPPTRYGTLRAKSQGEQGRVDSAKMVYKLRNELELPDPKSGALVKGQRLPETQGEMYDAVNQSMRTIGSWIEDIANQSSKFGIQIKPTEAVSEMRKIANSNAFTDEQRNQAAKLGEYFEREISKGGWTPKNAIDRLAAFNNDIKSIYLGQNKSGDSPAILALAARQFRKALNEEMKRGGENFAELRAEWGKLSQLQEDMLRNLEMRANKEVGGGMSVFNLLSAEQLISAMASQSMHKLITAAGSFTAGQVQKWIKSPDRAVQNIMKAVKHVEKDAVMKKPTLKEAPNFTMVTEERGLVPRGPLKDRTPKRDQTVGNIIPPEKGNFGEGPVVDAIYKDMNDVISNTAGITGGQRAGLLESPRNAVPIRQGWQPANRPGAVAERVITPQAGTRNIGSAGPDLGNVTDALKKLGYSEEQIKQFIKEQIESAILQVRK